jgi:xanthine/uracil permease
MTLSRTPDTPRHAAVAGLAVIAGTGLPPLATALGTKLPAAATQLLSQPVVVGAILALVLEVVLVQLPGERSPAPSREPSWSGETV